MTGNGGRTWRVGELARLTGLTVRALHHYEHVGLLAPSTRSAAGHRIYDERDLRRLYRVVALRDLGLSLESIRTVLDGGPDEPARLLRDHMAHVDQRLTALRTLRTRLEVLVRASEAGAGADALSPDGLLSVIEGVTAVDDTMRDYFSEEQLATLAERREQRGQRVIDAEIAEWPELISRVRAHMDAGTDPADPEVRSLADRWTPLLEGFHGGDEGLRDAMFRMQREHSEEIRERHGGPDPEMIDYIRRANAAG